MGPPAPPPRRCLLCRRDAQKLTNVNATRSKSCAISLCTIFGLPDTHPFKVIYERAQYCEQCLKEVQDADVMLGKLEMMKQSLIRFQNRVYSKLGDNYFQIDNRDELGVSYDDFESGGVAMKGKKFSYDEIVKVVYEKLDRDCLKWERFSSEGNIDTGASSSSSIPSKLVDISTQTENVLISSGVGAASIDGSSVVVIDDFEDNGAEVGGGDDWNCDDDTGAGGDGEDDHHHEGPSGGGPDFVIAPRDPLASPPKPKRVPQKIDYGPEAEGMPFAMKTPINFDEKIFCTFDPDSCKRFFYDNYNLKVHIKSFHEGNPNPHECTICHKEFVDEGRLKNHFLKVHHAPPKPSPQDDDPSALEEFFMCEHCGKDFPKAISLKDHVRKTHTGNRDAYTCSFCSAPFASSLDHQSHEDLHRSNAIPFACVFCATNFTHSIALKRHFNQTHAENKLTCEICGKVLAHEWSLRNHKKLHTNQFKCPEPDCTFTGTNKNALTRHMVCHSTERAFTCEQCGRTFKHRKNLTTHMRLHTGEKPYVCTICGQSFREQGYLRCHEETHSNMRSYQCAECGATFKTKETLKRHRRTHRQDYVPKKKKPRTEAQKEARRLKTIMKRQLGLGLTGSAAEESAREENGMMRRLGRKSGGSAVVKAEQRGRRSLKRVTTKVAAGRKRVKKEVTSSEEEDEEDDEEEYEMEEKVEVDSAVASIQPYEPDSSMYSNTVVYQQTPGMSGGGGQSFGETATFIPVNVVNPQGVRTASQLVVRQKSQQHVPQYQFL